MSDTKSGASQAIQLTRTEFLRAIFGDIADLPKGEGVVHITARLKEDGQISAPAKRLVAGGKVPGSATHFVPVTLDAMETTSRNAIPRTKRNVLQAYAVVADDVGTKATAIPGLPPSWVMQTSVKEGKANYQFGWILEEPIDAGFYEGLLMKMVELKLTDPGCKDRAHMFRLPGSVKPGATEPYEANILASDWHPERMYSLAEIEKAIGHKAEFMELRKKGKDGLPEGTVGNDPFTNWVRDQDWYEGEVSPRGFESIECPWADEHSDSENPVNRMAGFSAPSDDDPHRTFSCFHGHCQDAGRDSKVFIDWCIEQGAPEVGVHYDDTAERRETRRADFLEAATLMAKHLPKVSEAGEVQSTPTSKVVDKVTASYTEEVASPYADKLVLDVTDPSTYEDKAHQLVEIMAEREMAFIYGGVPVIMGRKTSATGRVPVLDKRGRPVLDAQGNAVTEPAKVVQPVPFTNAILARRLKRIAYFERSSAPTKKNAPMIDVEPPKSMLADIIENVAIDDSPDAARLPAVANVASHPVWYNGELLFKNGYHPESQLFLQTGDLEIEEFASAEEAYRFLRHDWLGDYPFAREEDAVAALTIPLSMLCAKTALNDASGPPMIMITAAQAGTGKTMLASQLVMAVTGETPATAIYPDTEVERGKNITSSIMEGASHIIFDNIRSSSIMGNSHRMLTTLITAKVWEDRVLGVSKKYSGAASIVVVGTGNNVTMAEDMARRTMECRLQTPDGVLSVHRTYKRRSPFKWTQAHRGKILGALAAILRAGGAGVRTESTFPEWSDMVAAPLIKVSGATHFFEPWVEAAEEDAKGNATIGMTKVLEAIAGMPTPGGEAQPPEGCLFTAEEIRAGAGSAITGAFPDGAEITTEKVMHLLKRNQGVVLEGGFKLIGERANLRARTGSKLRWCFKVTRPAGTEAPMGEQETMDKITGKQSDKPKLRVIERPQ